MSRERERRRLMRENRRQRRNIDQMLRDVADWNKHHPDEEPIEVNGDGMISLVLAYLDQAWCELRDNVHPISPPPPRLVAYFETLP